MHGFVGNTVKVEDIDEELAHPTDSRLFAIAKAFDEGYSVDRIHNLTKIDLWFLQRLENIHLLKEELRQFRSETSIPKELLLKAKQYGFSDFQVARFTVDDISLSAHERMLRVRAYRKSLGILPCVKQIDTLAGEYPAQTNYLYVTYNGTKNDVEYEHDGRSVVV